MNSVQHPGTGSALLRLTQPGAPSAITVLTRPEIPKRMWRQSTRRCARLLRRFPQMRGHWRINPILGDVKLDTVLRCAASIMSVASSTVNAIGFSTRDVFSRLRRRDRHRFMQRVRRTDRNCINPRISQHIVRGANTLSRYPRRTPSCAGARSSLSAIAVISILPSNSAAARICRWPAQPTPITPSRSISPPSPHPRSSLQHCDDAWACHACPLAAGRRYTRRSQSTPIWPLGRARQPRSCS